MLANSLFFLASAALALASPVRKFDSSGCSSSRSQPVLPVHGGDRELPPPAVNVTLKHIALGFGIQNYSCANAGADPKATGAVAMLYDLTSLYPGSGRRASLDDEAFASIPDIALNGHKVPLNLLGDQPGASPTDPFPEDAPLKIEGYQRFPFLGHHYFNAGGVPTFDLKHGKELLLAKKIDGVKAPLSADPGPEGTGAVDWLYLGDAGGSRGVSYVYRVYTSGGNSHGCDSEGSDSTSYTTMYWFYG